MSPPAKPGAYLNELGVTQEQVSRWRENPPQYARAYLDRVDELAKAKTVAEKTQVFIESLKE